MSLSEIPVVDVGSAADAARALPHQVDDILAAAGRRYTRPGLAIGDPVSRHWLARNRNPYRSEVAAVAEVFGRSGAHLLNCSYEWACTSGVVCRTDAAPVLVRVLDWNLGGLGRNLAVLRQSGPAGAWLNVGWPGFVGAITVVADGRFAIAINQPPMPRRGLGLAGDWLASRPAVWRSRHLPPSHLLRKVADEASDFDTAVAMLSTVPICAPAMFTMAGTRPGQGCVIERTRTEIAVRPAVPVAAVANAWVALDHLGGRPRGRDSAERRLQLETLLAEADVAELFDMRWLTAPMLNRDTRIAMVANPASGRLSLQGWEKDGPATASLFHAGAGAEARRGRAA